MEGRGKGEGEGERRQGVLLLGGEVGWVGKGGVWCGVG